MDRYLSYIQFAFLGLWLHLIRKQRFYTGLAILLFVIIPTSVLLLPSSGFPSGTLVVVEEDASFAETAAMLEKRNIIESATLLKGLARISGTDRNVKAGRYLFSSPQGTGVVLYRLAAGDSGIAAIRVTFPEGITVREMADILADRIPGFYTEAFKREATAQEGYLFPDTYAFYGDSTPDDVISRMRARFDEVWSIVEKESREHEPAGEALTNESQERIVIMASILEKETKPGEDRHIVSGILWDRIAIELPLQVDAVFGYIKGIDTYHPSGEDLELDSPYNTYRNRDLPPGPIGNPGEDALRSAFFPHRTTYMYYLTGNDGTMRYADGFEEHKKNKDLYLR